MVLGLSIDILTTTTSTEMVGHMFTSNHRGWRLASMRHSHKILIYMIESASSQASEIIFTQKKMIKITWFCQGITFLGKMPTCNRQISKRLAHPSERWCVEVKVEAFLWQNVADLLSLALHYDAIAFCGSNYWRKDRNKRRRVKNSFINGKGYTIFQFPRSVCV